MGDMEIIGQLDAEAQESAGLLRELYHGYLRMGNTKGEEHDKAAKAFGESVFKIPAHLAKYSR